MPDSADCRLITDTLTGWRAVILENGLLRIVVLPERGAEILNFIHLPSGVDALYQAHWGLQPPGSPPRAGTSERAFEQHYAGGWQELFPSANHACTYQGRTVPFHGEVATLTWAYTVVTDTPDEIAVLFSVRCRQTPFRIERRMTLKRGEPTLYLDETVFNEASNPAHFVWGQHAVVGAPFLEAGCRLELPAGAFHNNPTVYDESARLAPGQHGIWPVAELRGGGMLDLQEVLGPEAHSHDGIFATGLSDGRLAVTNPRLGLTFSLHWDREVYKWVTIWLPYGGPESQFLSGVYALGIEPWSAPHNLEQALQAGDAIAVPGGGSFHTAMHATFQPTPA